MKRAHIVVAVLLLFGAAELVAAQQCESLNAESASALASYLDKVTDPLQNEPCVAFAIKKLGEQRYEAALPVLTKSLDFRWPPDARQKQRLYVLEYDGSSIYPAAEALKKIGKNSLPAILNEIKSGPMSRESMEVALSVWMTIYKDQAPAGVAVLQKEADQATNLGAKQRLRWAAAHAAMFWCAPSDRKQCWAVVNTSSQQHASEASPATMPKDAGTQPKLAQPN